MQAMLFAPPGYWLLTEAGRAAICNGCGPKGLAAVVPDTIWGLRVTAACDIHDYMYAVGETIEDKASADRAFLNNLLRLIEAGTRRRWLKRLRALRAYKYYHAVNLFGGPAFWARKNKPEEMGPA